MYTYIYIYIYIYIGIDIYVYIHVFVKHGMDTGGRDMQAPRGPAIRRGNALDPALTE